MKNGNGSKRSAEKYVADQLKILKKFGSPVKLSNRVYRTLVAKISRAASAS